MSDSYESPQNQAAESVSEEQKLYLAQTLVDKFPLGSIGGDPNDPKLNYDAVTAYGRKLNVRALNLQFPTESETVWQVKLFPMRKGAQFAVDRVGQVNETVSTTETYDIVFDNEHTAKVLKELEDGTSTDQVEPVDLHRLSSDLQSSTITLSTFLPPIRRRPPNSGLVLGESGEGIYTDPSNPEVATKGKYYMDGGGRIIDIASGDEVYHGDGHSLITQKTYQAIRDYEKTRGKQS